MNAVGQGADVEVQQRADQEAVMRHFFGKAPLDPIVEQRVHEEAANVTEEIRRTHGVIDDETFQAILDDDQ